MQGIHKPKIQHPSYIVHILGGHQDKTSTQIPLVGQFEGSNNGEIFTNKSPVKNIREFDTTFNLKPLGYKIVNNKVDGKN